MFGLGAQELMLILLMITRPQGLLGTRELSLRGLFRGPRRPTPA